MPPMSGIDWRCPSHVLEKMPKSRKGAGVRGISIGCVKVEMIEMKGCMEGYIKGARKLTNKTLIYLNLASRSEDGINKANMFFQMHTYADKMPKIVSDWQYIDIFGDIFRVMFEPVPTLAQRINKTMTELGLKENEYSSAHVRARYPTAKIKTIVDTTGFEDYKNVEDILNPVIDNALRCANRIAPDLTKIFFASDQHDIIDSIEKRNISFGEGGETRVVGIHQNTIIKHFDKTYNDTKASDFYSLFEDLLIMGGSRCVTHGVGSFGAFGAGISGNRCRGIHRNKRGNAIKCPNDKTEIVCMPIETYSNGSLLFGNVVDGPGKIYPIGCNSSNTQNGQIKEKINTTA